MPRRDVGLIWMLYAILCVLTVMPIAMLVLGSLLRHAPEVLRLDLSGIGLQNYRTVLADPAFGGLVSATLVGAVLGTAGALVVGTTMAWLVVRTDVRGKRWLSISAVAPLFVEPLIGAFAWDMLASPRSGILNVLLHSLHLPLSLNAYSLSGIVFVFVLYYSPFAYIFVSAALRNLDPALEEAALICGANQRRVALTVTLPLVTPALASSALLIMVLLLQLFSIPAVLGLPGGLHFAPVHIWELLDFAPPRVNEASALGVLLLFLTVLLVALQGRVLHGRSFVTLAGKGFRPRQAELGRWRPFWTGLGLLYVLLSVVLPYLVLVLVALRKTLFFSTLSTMLDPSQFGLENVREALSDPVVLQSVRNTLLVALVVAVTGGAFYFALAYSVHRTRARGRRLLEYLAILPVAVPGIIMGLGYLWFWITIPAGVYGTIWILVLAFVSQFSPQGEQAIASTLVQIHPELEECSRICGASLLSTLWRIVLPLARPGLVAGMLLVFLLSVRELVIPLFLYTTNSNVLAVTLFSYWMRSSSGVVAVLALLQTSVLFFVALPVQRLGESVISLP